MSVDAISGPRKNLSWAAMTLILTNIGLVTLAASALLWFGSFTAALAWLRGERLIPDGSLKSIGRIGRGESRKVAFTLANMSSRQINLIGSRASCTCMVADGLPATVPPGGKTSVNVEYRSGALPKRVSELVRIYTDDPAQPELVLGIEGEIRGGPGGAAGRPPDTPS